MILMHLTVVNEKALNNQNNPALEIVYRRRDC